MNIVARALDCALLEAKRIDDIRGWFQIDFSMAELQSQALPFRGVVQMNHSFTEHSGVIRGLNFQSAPFEQAKVVSCIAGSVYSVGVNITPSSPSFGHWCGFALSAANHRVMYVPRGYAHGFVTLCDNTELQYFTDNIYSHEHAKSIRYDDPDLNIDWTMNGGIVVRPDILSEKNRNAPYLRDVVNNDLYLRE